MEQNSAFLRACYIILCGEELENIPNDSILY